ncbi:MAG TPA: polysaccharide biosynthesis tyrosine autokinase [Flavobacteriales bacterium]|nr:polysaccharide biosynthesis tyrosine autokinase [Flavobacteriales bacterium]
MAAPKAQQRGNIIDAKDLRYFLRIASKNWYFVVIALLLSAVLSYLYSYKLPDIHGATTQILLKDQEVYDYQSQVYKSLGYVQSYSDIVNQKRVLTSYDLIDAALEKLDFDISYFIVGRFKTTQVYGTLPFTIDIDVLDPKLYERPFDLRILDGSKFELSYDRNGKIEKRVFRFDEDARDPENQFIIRIDRSPLFGDSGLERAKGTDYQFIKHERSNLVKKYKGRIAVDNQEFTTILDVTVEDEVGIRAKMFLDTLSHQYIQYSLQSEFDINQNTLEYIDKQLGEVTVILERHEDELQTYKENKDILNLSREEGLYFSELVKYDQLRRQQELEVQSLDALEEYVRSNGNEKLLPPAIFIADDAFLRQTLGQLYEMQMERNEDMFNATNENMAVQRLDSTIQLNKANLLTYIKNARQAIQGRIGDIQQQANDYEGLIRKLPKSQRDILNIERRLQVNEKMYLFLLEKRASTVIARAGIVPKTKVIESARGLGVVRPDKMKIFYTFMLGGGVLAILVVFIRVLFYDRIENAEQLKELTTYPIFGEIINSEKAEENYVVVDSDPKAAITESFRTVRTNLEYVPVEGDRGKVVLVTSYRPNEGKTFCSVNLTAILAKAGKKVLLLELDLHKPKVATGLGMSSTVGLSTVLIGKATWRQAVMPTQFENFNVILAGPTPPNASELILSKHLQQLFEEASHEYDYVIVDTPPVGLITDALLMVRHADATLFVVNTRFASKDHVNNALEVLQSNTAKNLGFILNGVRIKKSKYYYNTNYGYGYRYAYGYGTGYGYGYGYGRRKSSKAAEGEAKKPNVRD